MHTVINSINKTKNVPIHALRIVSVVPSLTELLFDLGLNEEVVGITKFCVHPQQWFKTKTRIGGTKNINTQKVLDLQPNLIIANKEENNKEQIELLSTYCNTIITDIFDIPSALVAIDAIGGFVYKQQKALHITTQLRKDFQTITKLNSLPTALYLIWQKPYMAAGSDTFINTMLHHAGYNNCIQALRYPSLTIQEIIKLNPSNILLSSEPFPFKQKHIDELKTYLPEANIFLVDGEIFSWYGSRMLHAKKYFSTLHAST